MPKFKPYPGESPSEALERISENIESEGLPTTNAMERSESYQLGGAVRPPTAPSITPTPQYKKGGRIKEKAAEVKEDVRTRVQDVRHRFGEKVEKRKAARKKKKIDKLEKKISKLKGEKPSKKPKKRALAGRPAPGPEPPKLSKKKKKHKESDWKEPTVFGKQFKKGVS